MVLLFGENMKCSLCKIKAEAFYREKKKEYFKCGNCRGILLAPEFFLDEREEKARYETHNNDPKDVRYQKFVSPVVNSVVESFPPDRKGLDFGCGTGPVIQYLLSRRGFEVELYDPFFKKNASVLRDKYDFIVCCEVIEHFHRPAEEFARLFALLRPGGKLFCMTDLYGDETDFGAWYYKNDPTHVFFYHKQTVQVIGEKFGFSGWRVENRLIVFERGTIEN